jgi:hypothetical protein
MSRTLAPAAESLLEAGLARAVELIRHTAFDGAVRVLIVATDAADLIEKQEAGR